MARGSESDFVFYTLLRVLVPKCSGIQDSGRSERNKGVCVEDTVEGTPWRDHHEGEEKLVSKEEKKNVSISLMMRKLIL